MYNNKIVNFHVSTGLKPLSCDPNVFTLKKKSKVTRWLIRVLKKSNIIEEDIQYQLYSDVSRVDLDLSRLVDFLMEEMYYFLSNNIKIEKVILGRKQYNELINGELFKEVKDLPYFEIMGARVQLNPFIDGVVFIPKEKW